MPEAKNRNCGVYVNGKVCGKPAHQILGSWFPHYNEGQLWFYCDEHYALRDKLRDILGEHYAHASEKI